MECENIRKEYVNKLSELLTRASGNMPDVIAEVYELIRAEENKGFALQYFLEHGDEFESTKEKEIAAYFTEEELTKISDECDQMLKGNLTKIIAEKHSQESFYRELWSRMIEDNSMLQSEKEKRYALYFVWKDGRIPYYEINEGITMSNEVFCKIKEVKRDEIKKAIYILNSEFQQRTQRSSLLDEILQACSSEEERAVLLAMILAYVDYSATQNVLSEIEEKKTEILQ